MDKLPPELVSCIGIGWAFGIIGLALILSKGMQIWKKFWKPPRLESTPRRRRRGQAKKGKATTRQGRPRFTRYAR